MEVSVVTPTSPFLDAWHDAMIIAAIVMFLASILAFIIYKIQVSAISDFKLKHDFINQNEIKRLKWVFYLAGAGVAMLINLYGAGKIIDMGMWFFVRFFMSIAGATLVGYVAALVLDFYYPTKLNAKLRKWRYMPRVNPKTGNKMRLLSEDEEDVHLDPSMQAEESVFSIDYDVWRDEKTGDLLIEKYQGHLTALQCGNCGYYTMRVVREEIVERFEDDSPKELLKHYQCSYCKSVRATQFNISFKESEDYKNQKPAVRKNTKNVDLVRIEIHSGIDGKKFYEFQTVEQAQKFLEEFDFDKVA